VPAGTVRFFFEVGRSDAWSLDEHIPEVVRCLVFMVARWGLVTSGSEDVPLRRPVAVPVDVGTTGVSVMACDSRGVAAGQGSSR